MSLPEFDRLLNNFLNDKASSADRQLIRQYLKEEAYQAHAKQQIEIFLSADNESYTDYEAAEMFREVMAKAAAQPAYTTPAVHRVRFLKTAWFRYAAAVIVLVGVGLYFSPERNPRMTTATIDHPERSGSGINNNATLTLADGTQITLDTQQSGNIAQQGNTRIIKLDGNQLVYNSDNKKAGAASYNTITTPKGSQYQVVLPDGTKVWLNAMSSIHFPTAFTKATREVQIAGEAYMEIAKNSKQPFLVKAGGTEVQVLGTSFNINAYEDEPSRTSLIEGSIKVNEQLLVPGQAYSKGKIIQTDIDQDIAWKNGLFNFNGLSLKEAMNQLARWYDIEIVYEGELPPSGFYGKMWRSLPLKEVLNILSGMGGMHFKLEGKKLIVSASQ